MRAHTAAFSASVKNTQFDTSSAVRPQPLQTSSKSVEQTPMQGLSGRAWPKAGWAFKAGAIIALMAGLPLNPLRQGLGGGHAGEFQVGGRGRPKG